MATSTIKNSLDNKIQHNNKGDLVGYYATRTYEASELQNVSAGTLEVKNNNGVCSVKTVDIVCTPDVAVLDCRPFFGNVYMYDEDGGSKMIIDNGWLYFKEANMGKRIFTFIL